MVTWYFNVVLQINVDKKEMTGQAAGRPANRRGRTVYTKRDARDEDGAELCVLYSLLRCPDDDKPACQWQGRKLVHKVRQRKVQTMCSTNNDTQYL